MGLIKVAQLLGQTGEGGRTGLETADGPVDAQDPDKGMDAQPRLGPQQAGQVADAVAGLLGQGPRGGGTGGGGQMVQQGYGGGQSRAKGQQAPVQRLHKAVQVGAPQKARLRQGIQPGGELGQRPNPVSQLPLRHAGKGPEPARLELHKEPGRAGPQIVGHGDGPGGGAVSPGVQQPLPQGKHQTAAGVRDQGQHSGGRRRGDGCGQTEGIMGHKGPQGRVRAQVEVGEGPGRADAVPIPKDKSLQNITPHFVHPNTSAPTIQAGENKVK